MQDALFNAQGKRHREFVTARQEAFSMSRMPLEVANSTMHAIVEVDLSPRHWHVSDDVSPENVDVYFERIANLLRKKKLELDQGLS